MKKTFIVLFTTIIVAPLCLPTVTASLEKQDSEINSTFNIEAKNEANSSEITQSTSQSDSYENSKELNETGPEETNSSSSEITQNTNQPDSYENSKELNETNPEETSNSSSDKQQMNDDEGSNPQRLEEKKDEKKLSVPTLSEVESLWHVGYIDHIYKNITLTGYKQAAPDDVEIPGAVKIGDEIYDVFIQFTHGKTDTEMQEPSKSIWKEKFDSQGKCSIKTVTAVEYQGKRPIATGTLAYAFSQGSSTVNENWITTFPSLEKLDLKSLNVYNIQSTKAMVQNAPALEYVDVSNWDVSDAIDMTATFYANPELKNIIGLNTWNPFKVENLSYFFSLCYALNEASIRTVENWFSAEKYPRNLKYMDYMFWNTTLLTELDLSSKGWIEASKKITSLEGTFGATTFLKSINLNGWELNKIQSLYRTFFDTPALTSLSGLENSEMAELNNMKETFTYSGLEVIDLTSFSPINSVITNQTFFSTTPKKLLIINGTIENRPTPTLATYPFGSDNREKFAFPYLEANGGSFNDGTNQKEYIDNVVQKRYKIYAPENLSNLSQFKKENVPSREGYIFKGWEASSIDSTLSVDQIEACVDSGNIIDYNKNSIYFKAIWEPDKPATGPDNETPSDTKDSLDIAYYPKSFDFLETKLLDNNTSQLIPIKGKESESQYNIGVRDYSEETKGWELTAQLVWESKAIPGSSILTSNKKGEVNINKNSSSSFDPNLIVPQPSTETTHVIGVPNLEITSVSSIVMETRPSIQNKTFDYHLGTVKLKISDPTIVTPGNYNGYVNWNLSVVPKV